MLLRRVGLLTGPVHPERLRTPAGKEERLQSCFLCVSSAHARLELAVHRLRGWPSSSQLQVKKWVGAVRALFKVTRLSRGSVESELRPVSRNTAGTARVPLPKLYPSRPGCVPCALRSVPMFLVEGTSDGPAGGQGQPFLSETCEPVTVMPHTQLALIIPTQSSSPWRPRASCTQLLSVAVAQGLSEASLCSPCQ